MNGFGLFLRLGVIVLAMLGAVAIFAYVGGWLSPERLTRDQILATLSPGGGHPGFRRNHAKGVCVAGWFESNGEAAELSKAAVFQPGRVPLVGRFALAGGMPFQPDRPGTVRSMALRFLPSQGGEWRTGMNNIPVFPVNTARAFYDLQRAAAPDPATGKPDPAKMQPFLAAHPETQRALGLIAKRQISDGFANSTFNSLDAFRFVNASGASVPVRWSVVPLQPFEPAAAGQSPDSDANRLFDDLIAAIAHQPLRWNLVVTVGEPGDPTADATQAWPAGRRQVDAGTVVLDRSSSEDGGSCTDVNYDPLVLPPGIEPSDDPLLSARSAAYARSFTLRAGEAGEKRPSAVSPAEVSAGGRP
jgi:catalase